MDGATAPPLSPAPQAETVRLLDRDATLAAAVPASERPRAAARGWAQVAVLPAGPLALPRDPERFAGWFGLHVLEGLLVRRVAIGGAEWPELLGPGDLLRSWTTATEQAASIPAAARFEAVEPVRLALLDRAFAARVAPWPEIAAALLDRALERVRSLSYQLAANQPSRAEERIWIVLWHLADRWGRVTPAGVELALPGLDHRLLGSLLGVRRPTVSLAVRRLAEQGLLTHARGGRWLLHGPPDALAAGA